MHIVRRALAFLHRTDGSLQHKAIRSGVWVAASNVGVVILTFMRGVVLARLLSAETFGLMAVSLMATRFIEILTETGFGQALVHRQDRFEDARDTAFTMASLRGVALAVFSLAMAPAVASFYGQPQLRDIVAVVGISFIFVGLQNINAVALQKELDFRRLTYMELAVATLGFVVNVGLAWWRRDIWALVWGQIASAAIASLLSFLMVPGGVRWRFDRAIAKELYRYGRFITGLSVVVFLSRELDNAIIGKMLGMEQLGFYVVAYSLANIPSTYLSKVIARVMFPFFSRLQHDPAGLRREYERGQRLIISLTVPVSIVMVVLSPEIVAALYGPRWTAAVVPLQILVVFGAFRALWLLNGYLYNATGRPHIDFYVSLGRLLAMTALLFPLTRRYGVIGAAVAVSLPMAAQFAIGLLVSRAIVGSSPSATLGPLAVALLQSAVLAGVVWIARSWLPAEPRLTLPVLASVSGAIWLAFNARGLRSMLRAGGLA